MEIEFQCDHCGVVTYFDASHRGKSWPCRGCGEEAEISQREYDPDWEDEFANFAPFLPPSAENREMERDDEMEVISFRRTRETSRETEPRAGGGRTAISSVVLAIVFIAAGRLIFYSMRSRNSPTRKPTIKQQDFRAILEGRDRSPPSDFRTRTGPNHRAITDPERKALLEKAIQSGEAVWLGPDEIQKFVPR